MIRHVVLFKFIDAIGDEAISDIVQQLQSLLSDTPFTERESLSDGLGLLPNPDRSADLLCEMEFATADDFDAYLGSEPHRRFLDDNLGNFRQVLAIQVEPQASDRRPT